MDQFVSISSSDRTYGAINSFTIKYSNPIEYIRKIKSMQVSIPYSWYTVMTGINDIIYFLVGGVTYIATLTQGNYTGGALGTFLTEVQTQINTAYVPDNLYVVTLDPLLELFTITHPTASTSMVFGTNTAQSARKLLGFSAVDLVAGLTQTSQNVYSLTHDDTIFLRSATLANDSNRLANQKTSFILPIPVTGTFGDTIIFRAQGENWDITYSDDKGRSFNEIMLGLYFEDGTTLVPLNGLEWRFSFQAMSSK